MNPLNKRLLKGEAAAFAELYDLLGEKLYRYVFSQLRSSQDATDVVQEIFVRLVKSHRSLARAENLNSYIFAVARNETIRWRIKNENRSHQSLPPEDPATNYDATEKLIDSNDWVSNTLQSLDSADQEIVHLKAITKLTFKEIAEALQMAQSNVTTRYRRSMLKLQSTLSNQQSNNENAVQ